MPALSHFNNCSVTQACRLVGIREGNAQLGTGCLWFLWAQRGSGVAGSACHGLCLRGPGSAAGSSWEIGSKRKEDSGVLPTEAEGHGVAHCAQGAPFSLGDAQLG